MSVEQTTQLIQLILNSVLMSVACAFILSGLTTRHGTISSQLLAIQRVDQSLPLEHWQSDLSANAGRGRITYLRHQLRRLRYRYQITRYSVLSAYYALSLSIFSCLILVLRGMVEWNGLIPIALGAFVLAVATLLVSVGLTLIDWHLSDRPLLEETHKLLSFGMDEPFTHKGQKTRSLAVRSAAPNRRNTRVS